MSIKHLGGLAVRYGLLMTALLATASLSALATMRVVLSSRDVVVPDLLEARLRDAGSLLARQGLALRVEGKRHDPRVPRDRVAVQQPPAGSTLKENRSVRVWLSLGPRRLEVPSVTGQSLRSARLILNQAKVPLDRVVEVSSQAQSGTVLIQRPPAGETDDVGPGVSLLVSRGSSAGDYVMPDLIGRPGARVLQALELVGWKPAVRYRNYPGVAPGIVLRQRPASGERVGPRAAVVLEISR